MSPTHRRPRPETPRPAAPRANRGLLIGLAAGGFALVVIVVLAVALSADGPKEEAAARVERPKPPPPPPPPVEKPKEPPPPPPAESEKAKFEREMAEAKARELAAGEEEAEKLFRQGRRHLAQQEFDQALKAFTSLQKRLAETKFAKDRADEIARLAEAAKNRSQVVGSIGGPARADASREGYEARLRRRIDEANARVKSARAAADADRAADAKRQSELRTRLRGVKLDLRTKSRQALKNAVIVDVRRDDLRLAYEADAGAVEGDFAWETLDDRSFTAVVTALHKDRGAAGWYEMGRMLVARRLWKEAQAAFAECVKADPSFAARVPDLTKVLKNEGAFRGASRRTGRDGLSVTYDFAAPEQADDFESRTGGTKAVGSKGLEVRQADTGYWSLKDLEFRGDLVIEATASVEAGGWAAIPVFWNWEGHGYAVSLGEGFRLDRFGPSGRETLFERPDARLTGEATVRVRVQGGQITVHVNGQEVLAAADTAFTKGWCGVGAWRGTACFRRFSVSGTVNAVQLEKLLAESEVLVRRALEGDLASRETGRRMDRELSAEDPYFMADLAPEVRADYEKARETVTAILNRHEGDFEALEASIGRLIEIIKKAPRFHAATYWLARLLHLVGRLSEADDLLKQCTTNSEFHEALVARAEVALRLRRYEQAAVYADMALKRMPDGAPAFAARGYAKFCLADARGAVEDLDFSLRLDPYDGETRRRHRSVVNEIRGPESLGARHRTESPHFVVMTDMSPEKTRLYGERLEGAWRHYAETFQAFFKDDPKRTKPRVAIFNTREAYLTYSELTLLDRPENALGYYMADFRELLLFEDVDVDETLHTLYHEGFHYFMGLMVARPPYWFNEGMAEYMGAIRVEKGSVVAKAQVLEGRLKVLRAGMQWALPFADIMRQSPGEFYSGPVSFKYSQAWSMIHFLQERHRPLLDAYFRALLEGRSTEAAYDAAFGRTDMKSLEAQWRAHVDRMDLPKK